MHSNHSPWRVALIGECMIELQKSADGHIRQGFGGDTLNTAAYLARIGAPFGAAVSYISALGDDGFSLAMRAFWSSETIDHSLTRALPGRVPGLYFIELSPEGERSFSYWRGEAAARDTFEGEDGEALLDRLAAFDAIYCSGISLAVLRETGRARLLARLRDLHARGVRIIFDCNFRPVLWKGDGAQSPEANAQPWYAAIMATADIVFISRDEIRVLGLPPETGSTAVCKAVHDAGTAEVVLKDGGGICVVSSSGTEVAVPARRLDTVVDTTAAGDSFSAAYIQGRQLGLSPQTAAERAHVLAAAVVSHRGAVIPAEAMPDVFPPTLFS